MLSRILSSVALLSALTAPLACITEAAIKDLCSDDATCTSDPDCPQEPPNQGIRCDLPSGAECFYCTDSDRLNASHYECNDNGRWDRKVNTDCE